MEEDERNSPLEDDNESSQDDDSEPETELMVTSRARRATAGNRYDTVVAQEAVEQDDEDEVAMLFAEGEGEDEDFNTDEADEDADMSSSDDDDQGPNAAVDSGDGEKDLQNEAKAERARKRKADLALTTVAGLKKKPKIDPTALRRASVLKPTKRKERVSWLPVSDAAPGRTSLRKQTILHRAETHAKLKENEEQRLKLKAKREKREREREAEAPKEMTQADRLAEAERVERRNAKSLNRWEAMEKKRAEEQAAKLAALKDRTLDGAVITWYSSAGKYYGLKESRDNEVEAPVEQKKRGRKPKALLEQLAAAKLASGGGSSSLEQKHTVELRPASNVSSVHQKTSSVSPGHETVLVASGSTQQLDQPVARQIGTTPDSSPSQAAASMVKEEVDPFLNGINEYASMKTESKPREESMNAEVAIQIEATKGESGTEVVLVPEKLQTSKLEQQDEDTTSMISGKDFDAGDGVPEPNRSHHIDLTDQLPIDREMVEATQTTIDMVMSNTEDSTAGIVQASIDSTAIPPGQLKNDGSATIVVEVADTQSQPSPLTDDAEPNSSAALAEPPIEVISTRNLVILDKFDDLTDQHRQDFSLFYNIRKSGKSIKHTQELCAVTGLPAKYRDPATGIAYANAGAYKKLQELRNHQLTWSSMLGCYVGRLTTVARGVPEGFLGT